MPRTKGSRDKKKRKRRTMTEAEREQRRVKKLKEDDPDLFALQSAAYASIAALDQPEEEEETPAENAVENPYHRGTWASDGTSHMPEVPIAYQTFDGGSDDEFDETWDDAARSDSIMHKFLLALQKRCQFEESVDFVKANEERWLKQYLQMHRFWIRTDAAQGICRRLDIPQHGHAYYRDVFVWFPDEIGGTRFGMPTCVTCKSNEYVRKHSYPRNHPARRVASLPTHYFVLSRQYCCIACRTKKQRTPTRKIQYTFMGDNKKILESLPDEITNLFPAILTTKAGQDKHVPGPPCLPSKRPPPRAVIRALDRAEAETTAGEIMEFLAANDPAPDNEETGATGNLEDNEINGVQVVALEHSVEGNGTDEGRIGPSVGGTVDESNSDAQEAPPNTTDNATDEDAQQSLPDTAVAPGAQPNMPDATNTPNAADNAAEQDAQLRASDTANNAATQDTPHDTHTNNPTASGQSSIAENGRGIMAAPRNFHMPMVPNLPHLQQQTHFQTMLPQPTPYHMGVWPTPAGYMHYWTNPRTYNINGQMNTNNGQPRYEKRGKDKKKRNPRNCALCTKHGRKDFALKCPGRAKRSLCLLYTGEEATAKKVVMPQSLSI